MNRSVIRTITYTAFLAGFGAVALLGACTADQMATAQATQAKIQAAIVDACGVANAAAAAAAPFSAVPQVAGVLIFIQAGCGTAQAISALTTKAMNDPSTIAWVLDLSAKLRAGVAQVRGG